MTPRIGLCVLGVLLLCSTVLAEPVSSRKLLQRSVKNCTQLHPQCRSCSVLGTNSITNSTAMTCLACSPPAYRVTVNSLSCGKGKGTSSCFTCSSKQQHPEEQQQGLQDDKIHARLLIYDA